MTSMRIDGDKSAKVWARRLRKIIVDAMDDGCAFTWDDIAYSLDIEKGNEAYEIFFYKERNE